MSHIRNYYIVVLIAVVFSAYSYAQTVKPAVFISAEGEFSIDLSPPDSTHVVVPVADTHTGGKRYSWAAGATAKYDAGYVNLVPGTIPKGYVNETAESIIEKAKAQGATLRYKKDITLGDMVGVEVALTFKSGPLEAIFLNRIYSAKGRGYLLFSMGPAAENGAAQIKVLDSFRLTGPVKPETMTIPGVPAFFVSERYGFSIDLPARPDEESGTDDAPASKTFVWNQKGGDIVLLGFIDTPALTKDQQAAILTGAADRLIASLGEKGSKLEARKDIAVGEYPGVELRFLLKEGAIGVSRYYMVDSRLFIMTTGWDPATGGAAQLKILDSFKIIAPRK